ncbi:methylmalonyl-CoA epimerase [Emcibacteraceae bacterium]|nr:methylmalonyl-CoA epimerase [Emcibacteraceae bacterium]
MIEKLNHIAIAVPNLEDAISMYRNVLGAEVTEPLDLPEHGVRVAFVELENTKVELLLPIGENSPITSYLNKNASGGMHHICYEVSDIIEARDKLLNNGMRILGGSEPKIGAHGKPVLFLHPKDFCGTLIELEQV